MHDIDPNLLKEAEKLEEQSKSQIKFKDYDSAITSLLEARELYTKIGLTGQVGIVIKEIVRIKNLKRITPTRATTLVGLEEKDDSEIKEDLEITEYSEKNAYDILDKARELTLEERYNEALTLFEQAYSLFKKINYDFESKQTLWQINEIKEHLRWKQTGKGLMQKVNIKDIVTLASAERRRMKLQNQIESPKIIPTKKTPITPQGKRENMESKYPKLFQQRIKEQEKEQEKKQFQGNILKEHDSLRKQQTEERRERMRLLQEKKKREETLLKEAEDLLADGNRALVSKDYDNATSSYQQAIKIFNQMGWLDQTRTLQKELRNIELYKKEEQRKIEQKILIKKKNDHEFQKRVDSVTSEKQRFEEKKLQQRVVLPPLIRNKLEKVNLAKNKAEKEEKMGKFERVISRFQFILEEYKSIPNDVIDLSSEISATEQKLMELKEKK
ncbi:MAG: hypothetical protein KGD66_06115 [Candidatus Lokiarchaeota archaeon]|nr:hypothetical protein [Candidatus Lokiarchaeota archaeon]